MKRIYLILILIISGCVTIKTDEEMQSFVGNNIDVIISSWGSPDTKIENTAGGFAYTWIIKIDNGECRKSFITNSKNTVVSYSYYGYCPTLYQF